MASIWFALNHYAFDDAIFLAERLYSEIGSDENLHLLATCYYRASKPIAAYKILTRKPFKSSECTVLLAKCCCDLKKYDEAEKTLMIKCKKSTGKALLSTEDLISNFNESASFVSQLLGLICSKTERQNRAIEYYKKSLKINPFLWSSFEKLAQFGVKLDSSKIFDINNVDFNMCHGFNPLVNLCSTNDKTIDHLSSLKQNQQQYQSFNTINALDNQMQSNNFNCSNLTQTPSLISMKDLNQAHEIRSPFAFIKSTPEASSIDVITPENNWITTACLAPRKSINSTTSSKTIGRNKLPPNLPKKFNPLQIDKSSTMSNNKQNLRRSSRLFNSSSSVKENNTKTTRNMNQENSKKTLQTCSKTPTKRIKMSSNNNSSTSLHKSNNNLDNANYNLTDYQKTNDKTFLITNQSLSTEDLKQANIKMQRASAEGLLNLLSVLGQAALAIGQYKCEQAINTLQKLPKKHYQSGYVLTSIGRGYFELGKYEEAVAFFEEARRREPYLLKGMEYYSTALWHLQREVKLSSLAQELIEYDRNAPQTWCVAGNCFSLQKEHETAIKFLQRAIQVDVDFSYAYTLLGHEFVLTEEMDNAMKCFRNAIGIDNRHYNAFYGIGMIYYKQEKFKMAEVHYRKALQISQNPVLLCHLAVVQHALKKSDLALQTLNRAIEMDPKNALCKFHRASIKFSMDDYNSALSELEDLKQIVPKESLVYFLIGKVYKKLGNTHLALMNFSWAMDLDPKGANNQIKEVIDKQYPNEDDDQTLNSDPIRNDSTNSTDNSDNSLMRPHLSMSSSSDGIDEDDDN